MECTVWDGRELVRHVNFSNVRMRNGKFNFPVRSAHERPEFLFSRWMCECTAVLSMFYSETRHFAYATYGSKIVHSVCVSRKVHSMSVRLFTSKRKHHEIFCSQALLHCWERVYRGSQSRTFLKPLSRHLNFVSFESWVSARSSLSLLISASNHSFLTWKITREWESERGLCYRCSNHPFHSCLTKDISACSRVWVWEQIGSLPHPAVQHRMRQHDYNIL